MPNLGRFRALVTSVAAAVRRPPAEQQPESVGDDTAVPYRPRHSRENGAGATVPLGPVRARAQVPAQRFVVAGANAGRHAAP